MDAGLAARSPTRIEVPINGLFVMGLTLLITVAVACVMLYKSRWGLQVRAVVQNRTMSGAVGINTAKVDRLHLRARLRHRRRRRQRLHHDRLDRADRRASSTSSIPSWWSCSAAPQSLLGTIASAFTISQTQSTLEFFLTGSMAKVLTLLAVVGLLMLRPQGLFALKVRR